MLRRTLLESVTCRVYFANQAVLKFQDITEVALGVVPRQQRVAHKCRVSLIVERGSV